MKGTHVRYQLPLLDVFVSTLYFALFIV